MTALNLPNTLTTLRIVIIPVFVTAVIYGKYNYALYLFIAAALTDALDGLSARLRNQKTLLGTFLDPIADKFLIVTSFILFSYHGWVPWWLTITVLSRDIIVLIGWMLLYLTAHTLKVAPSVLGKTAIALQLIFLSYILININYEFVPGIKPALVWATGALTILSGLHYIQKGLRHSAER